MQRLNAPMSTVVALLAAAACSKKEPPPPAQPSPATREEKSAAAAPEPPDAGVASEGPPPEPKQGLVLGTSRMNGKQRKAARVEIVFFEPKSGKWEVTAFEDPASRAFYDAVPLLSSIEEPQLVTFAGPKAAIKGWRNQGEGFRAVTHFGDKLGAVREAEVGDVDGDNRVDLVFGTEDQGLVAYLERKADEPGAWRLEKVVEERGRSIRELELGDLDRDSALEIYVVSAATGRAATTHGKVVRYVPARKEQPKVVVDVGEREITELLVDDVDGDGAQELYVALAGQTRGKGADAEIVVPTEILRYDASTEPGEGQFVAQFPDLYSRSLTAGDVDGDGKKELFATAFTTGVWVVKPGPEPGAPWSVQALDTTPAGSDQAALVADLDEDGRGELYVAGDEQGQLLRYIWRDGKPKREIILERPGPPNIWTWSMAATSR